MRNAATTGWRSGSSTSRLSPISAVSQSQVPASWVVIRGRAPGARAASRTAAAAHRYLAWFPGRGKTDWLPRHLCDVARDYPLGKIDRQVLPGAKGHFPCEDCRLAVSHHGDGQLVIMSPSRCERRRLDDR